MSRREKALRILISTAMGSSVGLTLGLALVSASLLLDSYALNFFAGYVGIIVGSLVAVVIDEEVDLSA